jgi:hypothetical protein
MIAGVSINANTATIYPDDGMPASFRASIPATNVTMLSVCSRKK